MKAIYGGEEGWFNVQDNWFRPGPATRNLDGEWLDISTSQTTSMIPGSFYIDDNVYDVSAVRRGGLDGRLPDQGKIAHHQEEYEKVSVDEPFSISVATDAQDADDAYKAVLKYAGASLRRDSVDKRIVREVKKGSARFSGSVTGLPGLIDSESDIHITK